MTPFNIHDIETAPPNSVNALLQTEKSFGFIPNLVGTLAEAPATLDGYLALSDFFDGSSLSTTEKQIVLLSVSRSNECDYCLAAHSVSASMARVPRDIVNAIRDDQPIADSRHEALRRFTTAVVEKRGWVDASDLNAFAAAGYRHQQVLEVILGIAFKTLSSYTNHIAQTPLDAAFKSESWVPAARRKAG